MELTTKYLIGSFFSGEVKLSERFRILFSFNMVIYAGITSIYGSAGYYSQIGDLTVRTSESGLSALSALIIQPAVLLVLLSTAIFINYYISITGYTRQEKVFGTKMPMEYAAYQLANILLLISTAVLVLLPALFIYLFFGLDFSEASSWLSNIEKYLNNLPAHLDQIPTIFHFSPLFAYFASKVITGFISYWWHRLLHQWRPLWLIIHRPHHTPERISQMTSIVADDVSIGTVLKRLLLPFLTGVLAKLFSYDSTSIIEIVILFTILEFIFRLALEPIGHSLVHYQWAVKNKFILYGFFIFMGGPFHLMHHSSKPEHQVVNLTFCPLHFWDILFGTFVWPTKETPKTGLTNLPAVYMNPFRLAFGGIIEMYMEFKLNKNWKDRFLILFGTTKYNPPIRFYFYKKPIVSSVN